MQKIGMQREGVLRDAVRKWGHFEDVALHAILAPEWHRHRY
jgi:RimJ/RimL family protein N-acetyltransferase